MKKRNIIILHIIFWITVFISTGSTNIYYIDKAQIKYIIMGYSIYLISMFFLFYLFYFIINNNFLNKKKITLLSILGFLFTIIYNIPVTYIYVYSCFNFVLNYTGKKFFLAFSNFYFGLFEINIIFILAGSLLKISILWYESKIKQKEIEKQYVANELALLRAQINPHFLFNTLNNIKSLINTLPDKAIYSVEKLSEIMSYMLYESSEEKVPLENEINYIKNYLDLQKIRYNNSDLVDFNLTGEYSKIMIPPLIFIPFIENAFKYGDFLTEKTGIKINLEVNDYNITFEVSNYIKEMQRTETINGSFSSNIIKRRLDLLYEKNYKLEIFNADNKYTVRLNIKN